jgi:hypothetical protein
MVSWIFGRAMVGVEADYRRCLISLMRRSPISVQTESEFQRTLKKFGLKVRQFLRAWDAAMQEVLQLAGPNRVGPRQIKSPRQVKS